MDRGAWWAAVHGVAKESDTTERLHFYFSLSCIGEGDGNPLQCSFLENPWWAAVYGVAQSWIRLKRLSSSSSRDLLYRIVSVANNTYCTLKCAKRVDLMVSILTTSPHTKDSNNKGGGRKHPGVMYILMALMVVVISQI